ncbi:lipid storage droplets surface-binding protein 1 isoform X2 [Leptopilina boulardi]|uniref:lipid storage droplets surface-binding protein 1 isoform X2 n=1 Tax=Leptopilina boulardi TaxID=63433 RepID=UPI0021F6837A|nr:lipid storage droplets surface-binding protein 1 isoform X2 [Leptopilina boulardi]
MRYCQQLTKCSRHRVFSTWTSIYKISLSYYNIAANYRDMARSNFKRRHSDLSQFESVARISSFPIVESSIYIAGNVYEMIKRSNSLMNWSLDTVEQSLASAKSAIFALNGPITTIDQILCKGIDIVEQRVPAVHLPPQLMYWNTKEYVNKKIVKPVLMRADSMKQIGSHAANVAADRLDGALSVADQYIDHYLPGDPSDKIAEDTVDAPVESTSKTVRTIKHGARFSRKLQRRLTRRTLLEAKALKNQGTECIAVLLYVAELIATDPKLAYQKAKELWATLSLPEPENQARPATLEQLLVLLTREFTRRIVHLVNATAILASRSPRVFGRLLLTISHQMLAVADAVIKAAPIVRKEDAYKMSTAGMNSAINRLNSTTNRLLEQFAAFLAGRPRVQKANHNQNHNNHLRISSNPPVNGIE